MLLQKKEEEMKRKEGWAAEQFEADIICRFSIRLLSLEDQISVDIRYERKFLEIKQYRSLLVLAISVEETFLGHHSPQALRYTQVKCPTQSAILKLAYCLCSMIQLPDEVSDIL